LKISADFKWKQEPISRLRYGLGDPPKVPEGDDFAIRNGSKRSPLPSLLKASGMTGRSWG
jgi:hypothetical protein